ncbi:MAG: GAF domain-containing protein [Bdellovibrionales bacterium]|nr:GAF domain-containing protein [Bdellovibrionales bacterium]
MKKRVEDVSVNQPVWFQPEAPLGSAVRYIASLSPRFNWVGIYILRGKSLVLGPFIGEATEHKKIPVGTGICGTAVAENRDLNVPDVTQVKNYLSCSVATKSELVVLVRSLEGKILGQIDIDSHIPAAFGEQEESWVRQVARELGERWPHE